jgi:predicted O-methyltransferase YrrM
MMSDMNKASTLRTVSLRRMQKAVRRILIQTCFKPAPRHENAFATHLPILTGLGLMMPISTVLEFGAGALSTLHFLDKRVFSQVKSVVSYENDFEWYQIVRSKTSDPRLDLKFIPNEMYTVIDQIALSEFDLIFVDDSKSLQQRSQTILRLAEHQKHVRGIVVIHDFEQQAYRAAAAAFPYVKRFTAFNPEVGLVWSKRSLKTSFFQTIDKTTRRNAHRVPPDDVDAWVELFREQL